MAKAEKKVKVNLKSQGTGKGMKASDLTIEKRVEIANKMREDYTNSVRETTGLVEDTEMVFNRKAIVPRTVWVDTLAKPNGEENNTEQQGQTA